MDIHPYQYKEHPHNVEHLAFVQSKNQYQNIRYMYFDEQGFIKPAGIIALLYKMQYKDSIFFLSFALKKM